MYLGAMDNQREAQRLGGRKAALAFLWMFLFFEALMFYFGAHGDFAHEGHSFMLSQEDPLSTSGLVVAFVAVFFLGRVAGRQILVTGRNHMLVALVQWAITMGIVMMYIAVFSWIMKIVIEQWGTMFAILALILGCIWLIAVRSIRRARQRGS